MNINPNNNANLLVGEKVVCTSSVEFNDGTKHERGKIYTVEPSTRAYFSLFTGDAAHCVYLKIKQHE